MPNPSNSAVDSVRVPANALVLSPCLTREKLLAAPRARGVTDAQLLAAYDAQMSFDVLGCRYDFNTGFRVPDDCKPASAGETRALCPGVPQVFESDVARRLQNFAKSVAPVVTAMAPVFGPALSEAIMPFVAEVATALGVTGSSLVGEAIARLRKWFEDGVQKFFRVDLTTVVASAKETFSTLGVSAKTLVDFMKSSAVGLKTDAAMLVAYTNGREGLSIAENMLRGHASTIDLVRGVAVDSVAAVENLATARLRRDALRSLGSLQNAVDVVIDARGAVSPEILSNLVRTMPSLKNLSASALGASALSDFALDLSVDSVEKFAGKPEALLRKFDAEAIGNLIPDARRRYDFVIRALDARAVDLMLEPYVDRAERALAVDFDEVKVAIQNAPAATSTAARREFERRTRDAVAAANARADDIVRQGVILYSPREAGYAARRKSR